jgi:hypothetical protein
MEKATELSAAAGPSVDTPDSQERRFLSLAHRRFAAYIEEQPEELLRTRYAALRALDDSTQYPSQVWPVFLSQAKSDAFASVAVDLSRIFLDLPRRIFANDPARYEEFYAIDRDQARLIATLIETTDILDGATARGDFLETADGLKCLEFNVSGGLGGWSVGTWTRGYLSDPLIGGFLEQAKLETRFILPSLAVFDHILEEAGALADAGELNIAFAVPHEEVLTGGCWATDYEDEYQTVLALRDGLQGTAFTCPIADLKEEGGVLRLGGHRIHVVVEAGDGGITRPVLSALTSGAARVYNGPVNRVLGDKLNLALLSESADSDLWSAAEQETIRAHVPWTRRISADFVDFEGERAYLPDLLCDRRERMVVKAGYSAFGEEVFIGAGTTRADWMKIVERALDDQGWVAQEFLNGTTYHFPIDDDPEQPLCPHDLVWGLFTFGDRYGGNFVRLMVRGGHGVINAAQGACVGAVLEVDEDPGGGLLSLWWSPSTRGQVSDGVVLIL